MDGSTLCGVVKTSKGTLVSKVICNETFVVMVILKTIGTFECV
jgi:hypothetical protein